MKKNLTVLFICLGFIFNSNAQNLKKNLDIQISDVIDVNGNHSSLRVIEGADGGFYAIDFNPKGFKNGFRIIEFDFSMKEVKRSDILLKNGKIKLSFKDLYFNEDKLTLLTSTYFKKGTAVELFVQNIDLKSLKPILNPRLLTRFVPEGKNGSYGIKTTFSRDQSKFLLFRQESAGKKEKSSNIISVFDAEDNFQKIWSNSYESETIDKLEDIESIRVNDAGEVYLMLKEFDEKRKSTKDGQANYKFKLQEFSNNGDSKNEIYIDLKDEFITQIAIGINNQDDIVCTGFYSSFYSSSIKGCFYLLMDHETKSIVKESKKEFSIDFITSEMSDRKAKKLKNKKAKGKSIEMANFDLSDIVLKDDGGVIQVAERYYVTSSTTTDANGVSHTTYTYHFDELIVISITPEGIIEWARKIPKRQSAGSPYSSFVSYHLSVIGDKLFFFHNGNAENLIDDDKRKVKSWSTRKKATGIITEINSEGYMRKDIFYDYPGHQVFVLIGLTADFENEILFMSNFKKKVKFLKLKINE